MGCEAVLPRLSLARAIKYFCSTWLLGSIGTAARRAHALSVTCSCQGSAWSQPASFCFGVGILPHYTLGLMKPALELPWVESSILEQLPASQPSACHRICPRQSLPCDGGLPSGNHQWAGGVAVLRACVHFQLGADAFEIASNKGGSHLWRVLKNRRKLPTERARGVSPT